jgi:FkbM family methyltransferase
LSSISGPGTGLLLSAFLNDGGIIINLGQKRLRRTELFPIVSYMEEYFVASFPHLRALYYDRCSNPEIDSQELTKLIHKADGVARSCFDTSNIGYDSNVNKSPVARAYSQVFNKMVEDLDETPRYIYTTRINRGGGPRGPRECDWAEHLIFETPSCMEVVDAYGWDQKKYRQALQESLEKNKIDFRQCRRPAKYEACEDRDCVFSQIKAVFSVPNCILPGDGQGNKAVLDMKRLYDSGDTCVVFSGGISESYQEEHYFEKEMAKHCKVYAFDCTVQDKAGKMQTDGIEFSPVCIGSGSHGKIGNAFKKTSGDKKGSNDQAFVFTSLLQLIKEKKLPRVDLLKLDIEGYEWDVLENELSEVWKEDESMLPDQISFELHTKWANPAYVPHEVISDKGRDEVNDLFLLLTEMGYYVISKDINRGDPARCEFVVARLNPTSSSTLGRRLIDHGCEPDVKGELN